jgi:hypothetical protein
MRQFIIAAAGLLILSPLALANTYQIDQINSYYSIEAGYDERLAYVGNRNLELKVTMKTPNGITIPEAGQLTLAAVQSTDEPKIKITRLYGKESVIEGTDLVSEYKYRIEIGSGVEPRIFKLTLEFHDPRQTSIYRYLDLNVGIRDGSKVRFIEGTSEPLLSGGQGVYRFKLANDYPDYTVNVRTIKISSVPSDLVESIGIAENVGIKSEVKGNVISFDSGLSIEPSQQRPVELVIKMKKMSSFQNWLFGFSDDTKLLFDISYDDSNGRIIPDYDAAAKIKVRPSDQVLLGAMLIGVLLGTGIKFYLEHLHKKGVITRKGVAVFMLVTVTVGITISIIAWAGEIEIIAFKKIDMSYDRPCVIFIIGLLGALSGVHYLYKWGKKFAIGESAQ